MSLEVGWQQHRCREPTTSGVPKADVDTAGGDRGGRGTMHRVLQSMTVVHGGGAQAPPHGERWWNGATREGAHPRAGWRRQVEGKLSKRDGVG